MLIAGLLAATLVLFSDSMLHLMQTKFAGRAKVAGTIISPTPVDIASPKTSLRSGPSGVGAFLSLGGGM